MTVGVSAGNGGDKVKRMTVGVSVGTGDDKVRRMTSE